MIQTIIVLVGIAIILIFIVIWNSKNCDKNKPGCKSENKPTNCKKPVCVNNGGWVCLDHKKPGTCKGVKPNCPIGTSLVCIDGVWECGSVCLPTPDNCPDGSDPVCTNGSWECAPVSDTCQGIKPTCPTGTSSVCVNGVWKCGTACDPTKAIQGCAKQACVNGSWKCSTDYNTDCNQNEIPSCPTNSSPICVNGDWDCGNVCSSTPDNCLDGSDPVCTNLGWVCAVSDTCQGDPALLDCPSSFPPICVNGDWNCGSTCSTMVPSCNDNSKPICINGDWECGSVCDPNTIPQDCPVSVSCINSKWRCTGFVYKDYVGGVLNSTTGPLTEGGGVNAGLIAYPCHDPLDPSCFVNSMAVPMSFNKNNFNPINRSIGFETNKLHKEYIIGYGMNPYHYYTEFIWDLTINPYPIIELDLFAGLCTSNNIDPSNTLDIYLTMFNSDVMDANGVVNAPIAICPIWGDTVAYLIGIIGPCNTTPPTGNYVLKGAQVPYKGSRWSFFQDMSGISMLKVGFSIWMYCPQAVGTNSFSMNIYYNDDTYNMKILKGPSTNSF